MVEGTLGRSRKLPPKPNPRRVLVVDDHPIARLGVRRILENQRDFNVVAEAATPQDAQAAIRACDPGGWCHVVSLATTW